MDRHRPAHKLSENFHRSEFVCKCGCGQDDVDAGLINILQTLRDEFQRPVRVHSGNRCSKYNKKVGGKAKSQHLRGRAADISIDGASPAKVGRAVERLLGGTGGLGVYDTFVHVDTRASAARW